MDLNGDVGEGFGRWVLGDDDAFIPFLTSANVACGFHGGDPASMRRCCAAARAAGVAVGAQVGYRDLAGFGRRHIDYEPAQLRDDVLYQVGALAGFAAAAGTAVGYVKPHGALYHACVGDARSAAAVVQAVVEFDASLAVLGAPGSVLLAVAAEAGLVTVAEGFADRAYLPDGRLVDRRRPGAVLADVAAVAAQAVRLAVDGQVVAVDGSVVAVPVGSLCVHGDTPAASRLAAAVRSALTAAGVPLVSFTAAGAAPRAS